MQRFLPSRVIRTPAGAGPRSRRCAGGFTLIELLVVVAILALLAGILFPVFSRARENGRRASCQSNLKQISLAQQMYLQENDLRYPPAPTNPDGDSGWANSLNMVGDPGIFQCPSDDENVGGTDYWMNGGLQGISESVIRFSSNVIMFGEGEEGAADFVLGPTTDAAYDNWEPDQEYARRHLDGANYAFTDGHVKWCHPNQISTTATANGTNFTFVPD